MVDEQKLRQLAEAANLSAKQMSDLSNPKFMVAVQQRRAFRKVVPAFAIVLLDELQTLRSERTALLANEQNLQAAVKQARIDALELSMEMCRNMVTPTMLRETAPNSAYEAACTDCEFAIESLKGKTP